MTTETTVTSIEITMDPQGLIGDQTFESQGLDEDATLERYAELVTEQIESAYPGATVSLEWGNVDRTRVSVETEGNASYDETTAAIEEHVQSIYEAAFEGRYGDWAVEL